VRYADDFVKVFKLHRGIGVPDGNEGRIEKFGLKTTPGKDPVNRIWKVMLAAIERKAARVSRRHSISWDHAMCQR